MRTPHPFLPHTHHMPHIHAHHAPQVGALTNGNCDVSLHLSALFDFAVTAADAGAPKPHLPPFLAAAESAGCHPAEIVHVGDSIESDLVGALDAGMRAVLLNRPELPARTPAEIQAMPEQSGERWIEAASLAEAAEAILGEWGASPP